MRFTCHYQPLHCLCAASGAPCTSCWRPGHWRAAIHFFSETSSSRCVRDRVSGIARLPSQSTKGELLSAVNTRFVRRELFPLVRVSFQASLCAWHHRISTLKLGLALRSTAMCLHV